MIRGRGGWAERPGRGRGCAPAGGVVVPVDPGRHGAVGGREFEIVRVDVQYAACPGCGAWLTRAHSSYLRFPADVPGAGRSVVLQLRVRRFRCGNTVCPRRTFLAP
ncbi:transposase family protein [Streptomyces sp. NPDC059568]|uniref:transposase family protein n=1 Tax=Streptomyces sp. NPDC059568 TaxID=3346868 RepID=UPI003674E3A1